VSERGAHFTGVQLHTDTAGALLSTVEIDAYAVESEDRLTLLDKDSRSGSIVRDVADTVVADLRGNGLSATGVRMGTGVSGLPGGIPPLATTEAGAPTT